MKKLLLMKGAAAPPQERRRIDDNLRDIEQLREQALQIIRNFHHKLCHIRVLDPACGTGNFLYVAMELMKRLEGEVLEFLEDAGITETLVSVDPHQFLGLELNPRAVAIAELVLWIGYLQWHFRTHGKTLPAEPVLKDFANIKQQDAVLDYDRQELLTDETGKPITRWNGYTTKLHPITGEEVPDETAQVESYKYLNPRPAKWPEADFIIGNPPFVAGKDMRIEFGDGYAEALWASRPHMPQSADFVMWWWDKAAETVASNKARRFGFITTNSIIQKFSRRVIERHMRATKPVSLLFAIPDHPWMKGSDRAAVRIAMTVGVAGERVGNLREVVSENELNTDAPKVKLSDRVGKIFADLAVGVDVTLSKPQTANSRLAYMGFKLHGKGFILNRSERDRIISQNAKSSDLIKPFVNGKDLAQYSRDAFVVDTYPINSDDLKSTTSEIYQLLYDRVKPERDQNREEFRRTYWWWFGRTHENQRSALNIHA